MALLVALGISFTTFGSETEKQPEVVANDYILDNGTWRAVPEQNCSGGTKTCQVRFGTNGPIYDLYDEMNLSTKKQNSNGVIIVL